MLKKDVKLVPAEPETPVVDRYLEQLGKSDATASINLPETNVRVSGPTDSRVILPQTNVRVGRPTDSRVVIRTGDDDIDFSYLHGNSERYWWSFGHWAPCSNGCGTGKNVLTLVHWKPLLWQTVNTQMKCSNFHQGLHCLLRLKQTISERKNIKI